MFKNTDKTIFTAYLIYFISMALFAIVKIAAGFGLFSNLHGEVSSIIYSIIIQVFIMFLIPFTLHAIINRKNGGVKKTLAITQFKPLKFKVILIAVALGVLAFFINIAVSTVFNGFLSFFGYESPSGTASGATPLFTGWTAFFVNILMVAVLPALCEEFLHRGILLNEMHRIGYKKAIVMSSLLFALIHFNINQVSYAFVLGLLMGMVVVISKSIWPAIIIHFLNNGISVYLSSARANGWLGHNFYDIINNFLQSQDPILTFVSTFSFLVLVAFAVIYLIMLLFKETTISKVNAALNSVLNEKEPVSEKEQYYSPTFLEKHKVLNEILLTKSTLNINVNKNTNPIDIVLPINRNIYKPNSLENSFLIASVVLGALATLFTFIWGIIW